MARAKRLGRAAVVAAAAGLAACASAPTQEMSNARQSLQAARDAGAREHAAGNFTSAEDYLRKAERELELRYYNRARHDAVVARSEAVKALSVAQAIQQAEAAIREASAAPQGAALAEAHDLLAEARAAAGEGKDKKAIRLAAEARRLLEPASDATPQR